MQLRWVNPDNNLVSFKRSRRPLFCDGITKPILDIIQSMPQNVAPGHPLHVYAKAVERSGYKGKGFMAAGAQSVVIEMNQATVFKITYQTFDDEYGNRPFDIPILERQNLSVSDNCMGKVDLTIFIQPKVRIVQRHIEVVYFTREVGRIGYDFNDPGERQLGYYSGKVVLVDPFAVVSLQ